MFVDLYWLYNKYRSCDVNVIVFGSYVFFLYSVVNYVKKVKQLNFFSSLCIFLISLNVAFTGFCLCGLVG